MYRKKYYKCDCEVECKQEDVLGAIQEKVKRIEEGRKDILCGLHLICCCCKICEGIRCIERGVCRIDKGLAGLIDELKGLEFECDYRNNGNIKNGVCGIKDALQTLNKGLCQLQNCCLCDGIESIQCGLQELDNALCYLVKGINDLQSERENRRNCRCC